MEMALRFCEMQLQYARIWARCASGWLPPYLPSPASPKPEGQRSRPLRKASIPLGFRVQKNGEAEWTEYWLRQGKYVIVGIAYHLFGMLIWLGCWWSIVLLADAVEFKVSWRDLFRTVDQFGSWAEICWLIQWARSQRWSLKFRHFSVGFSWAADDQQSEMQGAVAVDGLRRIDSCRIERGQFLLQYKLRTGRDLWSLRLLLFHQSAFVGVRHDTTVETSELNRCFYIADLNLSTKRCRYDRNNPTTGPFLRGQWALLFCHFEY